MPKNAILNIPNKDKFNWTFVHHADNILDLLLANYNSPEQARTLLDLGDLSRLEPTRAVAYHRDLGYPKTSCFHLGEPKPKQNLQGEYKLELKDPNIDYFVFGGIGWARLNWLPHSNR